MSCPVCPKATHLAQRLFRRVKAWRPATEHLHQAYDELFTAIDTKSALDFWPFGCANCAAANNS